MENKSLKITFPNEEMCKAFFNVYVLQNELPFHTENDLLEQTLKKAKEYVGEEYGSKYWLDPNNMRYEFIKTKKRRESNGRN